MIDAHTFGEPGQGIHFRVCGIAVVDLALTFVAAWALAAWQGWSPWWTFGALMVLGLVVHRALGVDTTLTVLSRRVIG